MIFTYPNGVNDLLSLHDYVIEWDKNNISFYMDDTLITSHNVLNCPQYKEAMVVLLNLAMGGDLGGTIDSSFNKVTMEIDYLAHCISTNQNNANRCNESTPAVYADDDDIENNLDHCPNTLSGEIVNESGCVEEVVNIAPEVSLSITQNNVLVSSIDISAGFVEISANATDENTDDNLSYI